MTVDPVVWAVNGLSRWAWQQMVGLAGDGLRQWVFWPIEWPPAVTELYAMSRNLAWAAAGLAVVVTVMRTMWPELRIAGSRGTTPLFLERLATAGLISAAGLWGVEMMVKVNNAAVSALIRNAAVWRPGAAPSGVLSPLVVLLMALALMGLMLYLSVFYAVRAIELYVLTAAIPWFALAWSTRTDDMLLGALVRELVAVVFIQTFHAAAFWLSVQLIGAHGSGVPGTFMALALLWFMTKLPGQFRRLVGAGGGPGQLWR